MSRINWLRVLNWDERGLENLRFIGYSYIITNSYEIASTIFEALVILEPQNAYNLQTLGGIYLEQKKYLLALNYLERSLHLDPSHQPTILNKTKALLSLGYKDQALLQAKKLTLSENPEIASQAEAILLAYP